MTYKKKDAIHYDPSVGCFIWEHEGESITLEANTAKEAKDEVSRYKREVKENLSD